MRITDRKERNYMEVTYSDDGKYARIDGISFCRDDRTGYYLHTVGGGKTGKRLHVYVWEKHHGEAPKGFAIHHIDNDKRNNEIENLECMSKSSHAKLHASEWDEERRERQRKIFEEKAGPAASRWHKSEEGRKWHSEHAREQAERRKPKTYTCEWCGKEFTSTAIQKCRFCSGKCSSAFRRASGVDNEARRCVICGEEFTTNKYWKRKRCAKCRHVKA